MIRQYQKRYLVWFSCGAASAVAAKLAIEKYGGRAEVLYCNTLASEHEDNQRFLGDVSQWVGAPVKIISSDKYADVDDVFMRTRYMSGVKGARCTTEMKKLPREKYQDVADVHIFGLTADEARRISDFEERNPELNIDWILRDTGIEKDDCYRILKEAGIALPVMYSLGFDHNNCKGCVKASSPGYWNKTRVHFPDVFERRCQQSRALGVRLVKLKGQRIFLDELPAGIGMKEKDEDIECGVVCQTPREEAVAAGRAGNMRKSKYKDGEVYVKRTANRRYKYEPAWAYDDEVNSLVAPAEYAVYRHPDSDTALARIVKAQDGWRVVVAVEGNAFGRAISPIDLNGFNAVKDWAVNHFYYTVPVTSTVREEEGRGGR